MEKKTLKRRGSQDAAARAELKRFKGETVRVTKGAHAKGNKAKGAPGTENTQKVPKTPKGGTPKGPNAPIGGAPKIRKSSIGGSPMGGAQKVPKDSVRGAAKGRKSSMCGASKGPKNVTGDLNISVVKEQNDILGDASKGPKCSLGKTPTPKKPTSGRKKSAVQKDVVDGILDMLKDKKIPVKQNAGKAANAKKAKVTSKTGIPAPIEEESKPKKAQPKRKKETEKENDEIPSKVRKKIIKGKAGPAKESFAEEESGSESSDEDWEEVAEINEPALDASGVPALPETQSSIEPVEIEIETPELAKRRERKEKRKAEFKAYLRRMMNRFNKDVREDTHKVHLLCLLANGFHRNHVCNLPDLQAVALSIIPEQYTKQPTARVDLLFLSNLVKWFIGKFTLAPELPEDYKEPLQFTLEKKFGILCARDEPEMVHIFLIILRSLQLLCRLVLSLQPIPLKPPSAKETKTTRCKSSNKSTGSKGSAAKGKKAVPKKSAKRDVAKEVKTLSDDESGKEDREIKTENMKSTEPVEADQSDLNNNVEKLISLVKDEGKAEVKDGTLVTKNQRRRTVSSNVSYKEDSGDDLSSDSDFMFSDSEDSFSSDQDSEYFSSKKRSSGSIKVEVSRNCEASSILKTDFKRPEKPKPLIDKVPGPSSSQGTKKRSKILSSDEEAMEVVVSARGMDQWLEVFMERDNRWVPIDCVHGTVNQPQQCYKTATKPMTYVVGIDNDGHVKDVTKRYDAVWMTSTRKRRIDTEWWDETIAHYRSPITEREKKEDLEFQAKLLDKPLPTSITEYKNHPLYALKRHLLKYEAIYPESSTILGYCKGEAVYSRECVHTLHSKDTWMKDARVVAIGEVPYKMVKGQSNRARKARLAVPENRDRDDLALYGLWQTEDYQPPVAVNGKVPRNEYGNVYLFKPCMLPIGCKHLHVPNLQRVARKLSIDCVPAITGFDFHCGFSHPVTDGYIVCKEFEDVLLDAWNIEQAELEKKENEKREKRVWGNWKLLIKGLLIRERLKKRYGAKDEASGSNLQAGAGFSSDEEEKPSKETPVQDATASWPQNRQVEDQQKGKQMRKTKREKKAEETHLFPFEKM